ncbi:cytochrome bd oxidase small subunit CydS [Sporosarcina sp. SG10008]|uniref:NhaP-type Na+/H+ or K+/H+ antiporter n=1 Tax=Sporosarcina psychrophila TaxID=1476 RepID=A0ABV2K8A3_SPOPS
MLHDILIFVAPCTIIFTAIVCAFWTSPKDGFVSKEK